MTEDEMVGWQHKLDGYEFGQAPGVTDGQGSLVCCSPWGGKESDLTEQPNNLTFKRDIYIYVCIYTILLTYLFLAVLVLCCRVGFSPVEASRG